MSKWKTENAPLNEMIEVEVDAPGNIRQAKLQIGQGQLVDGGGAGRPTGLRSQLPVSGYLLTDENGKQLTGIVKLIRWREIGGEGT